MDNVEAARTPKALASWTVPGQRSGGARNGALASWRDTEEDAPVGGPRVDDGGEDTMNGDGATPREMRPPKALAWTTASRTP